ncbi:hypothetical protein T492DRAFT_1014833 [Pavlovales sp. CCMP2436]|nr:hypothetical protein T492DRAFT_1014833 [Pavlovales sp. CCMP2436]
MRHGVCFLEREDLRQERDALLSAATEASRVVRRRPLSAAKPRQIHRQRLAAAAAAASATEAEAARTRNGAAAGGVITLDAVAHAAFEAERPNIKLLASEGRAQHAETELKALREKLEGAAETAKSSERQSDAWRQKYLDEVKANRGAAFRIDRTEERALARVCIDADARGLEAEILTWKELAIEREQGLRAVHRKLRGMQLGGTPNVAHDLALREMRREIERRLDIAIGDANDP